MTFATHGLVANLSRRSRLWFALCPLLCELGRGWGPLQLGQKQQQRLLSGQLRSEATTIERQYVIEQLQLRCHAMSRQYRTE